MSEVLADQTAMLAEQFALYSETALGFPKVQLAGVAVDAITTDPDFDEILAAGGVAESGGFRATVRKADVPTAPASLATISRRGEPELRVLSFRSALLTWEIVAGDPVSEERGA